MDRLRTMMDRNHQHPSSAAIPGNVPHDLDFGWVPAVVILLSHRVDGKCREYCAGASLNYSYWVVRYVEAWRIVRYRVAACSINRSEAAGEKIQEYMGFGRCGG